MGFKSFFTGVSHAIRQYQWPLLLIDFVVCVPQASKEPANGVGSNARLENQGLKHRKKSFVDIPRSQVAEKVRNCHSFAEHT